MKFVWEMKKEFEDDQAFRKFATWNSTFDVTNSCNRQKIEKSGALLWIIRMILKHVDVFK